MCEETLDLDGVAALFHAEPETVARYARTGELPGTRIGKRWIFLRKDVLAFLREQIDHDTTARRAEFAAPKSTADSQKPMLVLESQSSAAAVLLERPQRRRRAPLPVLPALQRVT